MVSMGRLRLWEAGSTLLRGTRAGLRATLMWLVGRRTLGLGRAGIFRAGAEPGRGVSHALHNEPSGGLSNVQTEHSHSTPGVLEASSPPAAAGVMVVKEAS